MQVHLLDREMPNEIVYISYKFGLRTEMHWRLSHRRLFKFYSEMNNIASKDYNKTYIEYIVATFSFTAYEFHAHFDWPTLALARSDIFKGCTSQYTISCTSCVGLFQHPTSDRNDFAWTHIYNDWVDAPPTPSHFILRQYIYVTQAEMPSNTHTQIHHNVAFSNSEDALNPTKSTE